MKNNLTKQQEGFLQRLEAATLYDSNLRDNGTDYTKNMRAFKDALDQEFEQQLSMQREDMMPVFEEINDIICGAKPKKAVKAKKE